MHTVIGTEEEDGLKGCPGFDGDAEGAVIEVFERAAGFVKCAFGENENGAVAGQRRFQFADAPGPAGGGSSIHQDDGPAIDISKEWVPGHFGFAENTEGVAADRLQDKGDVEV